MHNLAAMGMWAKAMVSGMDSPHVYGPTCTGSVIAFLKGIKQVRCRSASRVHINAVGPRLKPSDRKRKRGKLQRTVESCCRHLAHGDNSSGKLEQRSVGRIENPFP